MSKRFSRFLATLMLAISALAMLSVSFDAEARRFGGGRSFGRQSSNIMKQRQAVKPPAAQAQNAQRAQTPSAANRAAASGTAARSGMSRWLGPLAGIAAGLGIAALLSAFGLSGAFLEFISSLVLIGLVLFAIMFIVRRLRGNMPKAATQGANPMQRQNAQPSWEQSKPAVVPTPQYAAESITETAEPTPQDDTWFIPEDFDTPGFLSNAKAQFVKIQALWDKGDVNALSEYLTNDMLIEITPELEAQAGGTVTEIVLLNAELMGMEKVAGGHLASIRYSGMLRESANAEAERFEEVWNLYKTDGAGWLLAGVQQLPTDN